MRCLHKKYTKVGAVLSCTTRRGCTLCGRYITHLASLFCHGSVRKSTFPGPIISNRGELSEAIEQSLSRIWVNIASRRGNAEWLRTTDHIYPLETDGDERITEKCTDVRGPKTRASSPTHEDERIGDLFQEMALVFHASRWVDYQRELRLTSIRGS